MSSQMRGQAVPQVSQTKYFELTISTAQDYLQEHGKQLWTNVTRPVRMLQSIALWPLNRLIVLCESWKAVAIPVEMQFYVSHLQ